MTVPDTRFFRRGITKAIWVPAVASTAAPTVAEVTAGTDMSDDLANIAGFTYSNTPINTPDLGSTFTTSIPGEDTSATSTLTFYEKRVTNPLRTTLAKGTAGFVVIFFAGLAGATPAAGDKCEVWPVISTGPEREYSMGNDPARWMATFTPTGRPATDAVVAA